MKKGYLAFLALLMIPLVACKTNPNPTPSGGDDPTGGGEEEPQEVVERVVMGSLGFSNEEEVDVIAVKGITLTFDKAGGSNPPKYYDSGSAVRLYANNTLTVEAEGLTKLEFEFDTAKTGEMTSADGKYENANNAGSWEGNGSPVFTVTSGQRRIAALTVTYAGGEGGEGGGGSETVEYNAAKVVADIETIYGEELFEYDSEEDAYYTTFNMGDEDVEYTDTKAGQAVLKPAAEGLLDLLPNYLAKAEESFYGEEDDFWGDESGDTAYVIYLVPEEGSAVVELIGYCYEGYLLGQICVYDALPE